MEEKINRLADFSIQLTEGKVDNIFDYYMPLSSYCCRNVNEPITDDFNDVIGNDGGIILVMLKIRIKMLEMEYQKTKDDSLKNKISLYIKEYEEKYTEYMEVFRKKHSI